MAGWPGLKAAIARPDRSSPRSSIGIATSDQTPSDSLPDFHRVGRLRLSPRHGSPPKSPVFASRRQGETGLQDWAFAVTCEQAPSENASTTSASTPTAAVSICLIVTNCLKLPTCLTDTTDMNGPAPNFESLGTALRFAEKQHSVISHNIANVNTPHYQARELSFDEYLAAARTRNHDSSNPGGDGVRLATGLETRSDGNNVDLDREVARLKRNAMLFQTFQQLLVAQMNLMRKAISGQ